MRSVPAVRELHRRYRDRGLLVVGVHTPEFDVERDPENVRKAIAKLGVENPVVLDPDYRVWRAFGNRYWPALYLMARDGTVVWTHVGELHVDTPGWAEATRVIEASLER